MQIILEAVFSNLHLLVENQLTDKRRRLRLAQILTLSYEFCAVLTKLSDKLSYKLSDKLSDKLSSQTNQKFAYKLSDIIIWILGGFNQAYLFILENSVKIWASSLLLKNGTVHYSQYFPIRCLYVKYINYTLFLHIWLCK